MVQSVVLKKEILLEIGDGLDENGEIIYETDYWEKFVEDKIRFTQKGNSTLYAISLN